MLAKNEFKGKLYETLEEQLTIEHPVVTELIKPEQNWDLLRQLTLQGYQLTKNFLSYIECLFFHCPLPMHKRRLLINLWEEETGRISKTKNHVSLMRDFIRAIGISEVDQNAARPYPATQELIDYRTAACTSIDSYHIGAAAVTIASEGQNLEKRAGEARHSLLAEVYGIAEKDLLFFSVHAKEDVAHVREGVDLVADYCTTEEQQREALTAVRHTCRLFWNMYEEVYQRHAQAAQQRNG